MLRVLPFLLLTTIAVADAGAAGKKPGVWMTHMSPQALAEEGAQWDFVRTHVDVVEFYINTVAFYIPAEKLRDLVPILKKNSIKIAIECGYFDFENNSKDFTAPNPKGITDVPRTTFDDSVGEETARVEIAKIENLLAAGGEPDYVNMDGPVRRMLHPAADFGRADLRGFDSIDRCVDEMIDYMRVWRARFPKVQFFALTNFPNWGWKGEPAYTGAPPDGMLWGDYYEVVRKIIGKTKAARIPVLGVTADNPYEYFTGTHVHKPWINYQDEPKASAAADDQTKVDWAGRLLGLERYVESQGLRFNLIVNSEGGGLASAEAFSDGTLKFLDEYRKAGGSPAGYIIQSWYKCPEKVVPETERHTMTWLVKTVIERVKRPVAMD